MEFWDVYDQFGNDTGRKKPKGGVFLPGEYHLTVEAWIISNDGKLLVQRRADTCEILPGLWGLTTGGVRAGESSRQGCVREVREELGLTLKEEDLVFLRRIFREDHRLWDLYLIQKDAPIHTLSLQKTEVSDAKWVGLDEFRSMLANGSLYGYPEIEEVLDAAKRWIQSGFIK